MKSMKIMIFGYSGSGKSTVAKIISDHMHLPLLTTDKALFNSNWKKKNHEETDRIIQDFMNKNKCWIIEGNATNNLFIERGQAADIIIFMNFSRFVCYKQAKNRAKYFKNKPRDDRPNGCNEKFNLSFQFWILFTSRIGENKRKYKKLIELNKKKIINIKNRKQLDNFLKDFLENNGKDVLINYEREN